MTVKQFVMLLTAERISATAFHRSGYDPYAFCGPITAIVCKDGTSISVQAHGGCHAKFKDVHREGVFNWYSTTFGRELEMCETNCEELDQYGINTIEEIEAYVEKHGGIDIEATTATAVDYAIKILELRQNN